MRVSNNILEIMRVFGKAVKDQILLQRNSKNKKLSNIICIVPKMNKNLKEYHKLFLEVLRFYSGSHTC
jgi:hypothetical protein